jgi:hypothetical protein
VKVLIEAGKLTPVIDKTYPLNEVSEAIGYVGEGHARGKAVISTPTSTISPGGGCARSARCVAMAWYIAPATASTKTAATTSSSALTTHRPILLNALLTAPQDYTKQGGCVCAQGFLLKAYSPKGVEGVFSEVGMQDAACPAR